MNPAWVTKKELLMDQVKKSSETIRMRNYGRIIQNMVDYITTIEDEETKHLSLCYIASCMRQKNLIWNKDQEASIERIREDIEAENDVMNSAAARRREREMASEGEDA